MTFYSAKASAIGTKLPGDRNQLAEMSEKQTATPHSPEIGERSEYNFRVQWLVNFAAIP